MIGKIAAAFAVFLVLTPQMARGQGVDAQEGRGALRDADYPGVIGLSIDARDVAIALSRPMDVSITNRLPGTIVEIEPLDLPYVRVAFDLGATRLDALVTVESVERLALETGLRAWAMIKTVAIADVAVQGSALPTPRRWPVVGSQD